MTVWAILDTTNTIINVVDDLGSSASIFQYIPGQVQVDMKTLPLGVWAGFQLVNGTWLAPQLDPTPSILSQLASLSSAQRAVVVKEIITSPIVTNASTAVAVISS